MHRLKCVDLVIVRSLFFVFLPSHENCGCYGNGNSQNLHRSRDYVLWATHVPCFIKVLLLLFVKIDPRHYEYSMTFYSVFVNLRKKCALDCCTITNLNETNHNSTIA